MNTTSRILIATVYCLVSLLYLTGVINVLNECIDFMTGDNFNSTIFFNGLISIAFASVVICLMYIYVKIKFVDVEEEA